MATAEYDRDRGTAWRIWDLHVHTPASMVQGYGANTEETWARFIDELETLPPDMTVIGINDYWFLDGYRRVINARKNGRLKNLEAIFPVLELRLDHFGGTDGKLARVNLHVIFDPDLKPELIEAQFINALQPKVKLSPSHSNLNWQGVITPESLADLGAKIKSSVPAEQLKNYESDVREGFNNLNVGIEDVKAVLDGPYFKGRTLVGIGKTEWSDIKWNDQSIAAKKNVINEAHFVFTAYQDTSRWRTDVDRLRSSNVTHQVLDCSDAHHFSDSPEYMRLGACQTWMNTTPSLAGLSYAIEEFDRRVFVGLEPPALARVRRHPERFIERVRVASDDVDREIFAHDLPLNPGFVAVVGNKGQGKSALLDCIALGGNSSRSSEFAFLSTARFLSPRNQRVARDYFAEVTWATGFSRRALLTQSYDQAAPVMVEYLPQSFVERVCNLDPAEADADEFERELRTVLFTHIPEDLRAGEKSFDDLLTQKTRVSEDSLTRLRAELRNAIRSYVSLASFRAVNLRSEVESRLDLKVAEIRAAENDLAEVRSSLAELDSESNRDDHLSELTQRSREIEDLRSQLLSRLAANEYEQGRIIQRLTAMDAVVNRARAVQQDVQDLNAEALGILPREEFAEPFVSVKIDMDRYDAWRITEESSLADIRRVRQSIELDLEHCENERRQNADALAAADSARERLRQRVMQSEERVSALRGDDDDEESQKGLLALLDRIDRAPQEMDVLSANLIKASSRVYEALIAQLRAVESLYGPASDFISDSEVVKNAGLEFNAELRILPAWRSLSASLDGRKNGNFTDWLADLPTRVEDTSWSQLATQLEETLIRLGSEKGELDGAYRDPASALRTTATIDDFLMDLLGLNWLEVRFGLTGDGLPLSQLSPGQRGLVLALFYLVVDRRTTPLLLDQPEENLDNETIASKLVPAIHEAAGRRQTIVVTHNANLAIVGDADQIVHCQVNDQKFSVTSGSVAELNVARFALNVLEGTKPAFDNRRHKYEAFPELR